MADQVQTMGVAVHSARARCRQATKLARRALENEVSNKAVAAVMWAWKFSRTSNSRRRVVPGPSSATRW
eukprot:4055669-Prorocentrum_lima.AAC.1